jgi:hypothetical protein
MMAGLLATLNEYALVDGCLMHLDKGSGNASALSPSELNDSLPLSPINALSSRLSCREGGATYGNLFHGQAGCQVLNGI